MPAKTHMVFKTTTLTLPEQQRPWMEITGRQIYIIDPVITTVHSMGSHTFILPMNEPNVTNVLCVVPCMVFLNFYQMRGKYSPNPVYPRRFSRLVILRLRLKRKTHSAVRVLNAFYFQTDLTFAF